MGGINSSVAPEPALTANVKPITILHLSDMQFGANHRFGVRLGPEGDNPYDTLRARLILDLKNLRNNYGLAPDLMILTGDLAESGREAEFDAVLDLIRGLECELSLNRDRTIVIPGNHDINRDSSAAYFSKCASKVVEPIRPYWPKWEYYAEFFDELYRGLPQFVFSEGQPWTLFEIEPLKVVVAGLNSTIAESHKDKNATGEFGHFGLVGEKQCRWFEERLRSYKDSGWFRIGAVHHNAVRRAVDDDENLIDADLLRRVLDSTLNCLLHGHTHHAKEEWWNASLPILSTGSTSLKENQRPGEVPNQYQVIQFWPDRVCRFARAYAPDRGQWIGDTRMSKLGNEWQESTKLRFQSVHTAFPEVSKPEDNIQREPTPEHPACKFLIDNLCSRRYSNLTEEDKEYFEFVNRHFMDIIMDQDPFFREDFISTFSLHEPTPKEMDGDGAAISASGYIRWKRETDYLLRALRDSCEDDIKSQTSNVIEPDMLPLALKHTRFGIEVRAISRAGASLLNWDIEQVLKPSEATQNAQVLLDKGCIEGNVETRGRQVFYSVSYKKEELGEPVLDFQIRVPWVVGRKRMSIRVWEKQFLRRDENFYHLNIRHPTKGIRTEMTLGSGLEAWQILEPTFAPTKYPSIRTSDTMADGGDKQAEVVMDGPNICKATLPSWVLPGIALLMEWRYPLTDPLFRASLKEPGSQ